MDFEPSKRCSEFKERLSAFMDEHVYPAEEVYERQLRGVRRTRTTTRPSWRSSRRRAREAGLWNMFLPDAEHGAGLSNADYAPLAEILGRSHIASEACNCSAPDTGNMEVLHQFGTDEQKERWLRPLLDGEIRSGVRDDRARRRQLGRHQHRDAHRPRRRGLRAQRPQVVDLERDAPELPDHDRDGQDRARRRRRYRQQIHDPRPARHARRDRRCATCRCSATTTRRATPKSTSRTCACPASNLIAGEGDGFMIAQARLGPGRIHHCMRAIGVAERALEAMCKRAVSRVTFGAAAGRRAATCRTGSPSRASKSRWPGC